MAAESQETSRLLAWLQLMRLPNVFTAMADIAMGFLFTHETLQPVGVFALLLLSSSALYTAGMVSNDLFDLGQDRRERPQRPLPSGRVPMGSAVRLAFLLILIGEISGVAAAWLANTWQPVIVIPILTVVILRYNSRWKRTAAGPIAMGGCRFLNVMLGMSATSTAWGAANFAVAAGIGIYIVGITWFARREATASSQSQLLGGFIALLVGITLLWSFPFFPAHDVLDSMFAGHWQYWSLLWLALAALIGWRFVRAIGNPQPALVQTAMKTGILSIIILDAAVVFEIRGCVPAIGVLALLIPAIVMGRWVYST